MNAALAAHLVDVNITKVMAEPFPHPGQTADIVAIHVEYSSSTPLPSKFIAKIAATDQSTMNNVVKPLDLYYKEYSFYHEAIEGINYPSCYYSAFDSDSQALVLLFEDISHLDSPSWNPSLQQVETAVGKLALFHARWWNDASLKAKPWLTAQSDPALMGMYVDLAYAAIPTVDDLMDEDCSYLNEIVRTFVENKTAALNYINSRPYTFVHGDYHPKQMFFGKPGSTEDFVMIDWQLPLRGPGANDLARIVVLGMDTETRRKQEPRLMRKYLKLLSENGVNDYQMEDLLEDYRIGIFTSVAIHYLAAVTDIQRFIDEVTCLGLDWQEMANYRLKRALQDHDGHELMAVWRNWQS
ncbi:MAG: DUF1679 domain-containing protein [Gammaproteobacteria bacterium]|nr:DUF1679 domain-containing protein [Gammaproteobacteria bacterium]MBT6244770.1 DUF1679 domain-containing protein [Gammaproteobacteria bacterium]